MELLKVENLSVEIGRQKDKVKPVRDVSFSLHKGEVLAIVGESGCGKSMLCKSVIGLLPKSGKITAGSIYVAGTDITHYTERQMEKLRGSFFSMIFQSSYYCVYYNDCKDQLHMLMCKQMILAIFFVA